MTPEQWEAIQDTLHEALQMRSEERASFLAKIGTDDPELQRELESLIAAHDQADEEFLQGPQEVIRLPLPVPPSPFIGKRIGNYQILEALGAGGMGEIYRAVRSDDQYRKQVAIKLLRAGPDSGFIIARFRNERQILASLDHPNIARLLDGGTTEEGVPYFVMELIDGQSLDRYCDAHRLTTTERLKLFSQVCSAVQFAHQRLIIHRDIKPNNILVTADGTPKLLDFGIAKILDRDAATTRFEVTRTEFRALTPGYASPEQIKGEAITTASDVYSLGVVLYELLTGHAPYRVTSHALHEITRAVCEKEPEKPSAAVNRSEAAGDDRPEITPASVSAMRDGSPEKLRRRLDGDLDNIVLMALRKEPQRRYSSVEQLREDIRRHLENLPVSARQDTIAYRTSKFVIRHKAGVAAAVAISATLILGMAMTLREAKIARMERIRAEHRFNDVRDLSNTLLFKIDDSIRDVPGTTQAQQLLISSARQYLDSLSQEASGDLSLLQELAVGYERLGEIQGGRRGPNLGDSRSAVESYRKAVKLRETIAQAKPSDTKSQHALQIAYDELGYALLRVDQKQSAEYFGKSMNIASALANKNPGDANLLEALAMCYEHQGALLTLKNDMKGALESQQESLLLSQKLVDMSPTDSHRLNLSYGHKRLGALLINGNKLAEALAHYEAALALDEALLAAHPSDPKLRYGITYTNSDIGFIYWKQGDLDKALANYHKVLAVREAIAAADPHDAQASLGVAKTCGYLADILRDKKKFRDALEYNRRELELRAKHAAANPDNANDAVDAAEAKWDLAADYLGIAYQTNAKSEKLRLLRVAQNYIQQAVPAFATAQARGLLFGSEVQVPQQISQSLAKCNHEIAALEGGKPQ